jgi:murein DD-endopeptidase MepM/ murein hydrolase activator NlpD
MDQQVVRLQVAGVGGVPDHPAAVALNVTGTESTAGGFVTAWPCDQPRPLASNLNLTPGLTTPNLVLATPSRAGQVCLYVQRGADLVVDLTGHLPADAGYRAAPVPTRVLDTRDGTGARRGPVAAGAVISFRVSEVAGLPAHPAAVVVNLTATEVTAPGYVTAWPCDQPRPLASSLNLAPGLTTPNLVLARPSASGEVCLLTTAAAHLIADVAGAFTGTSTYLPAANPTRLLDTRDGTGAPARALLAGQTLRLRVGGRAGIGLGIEAVALNLTATEVGAPGYVTAWPCDEPRPLASSLNLTPGLVTPNLVIARPGGTGDVCLFTSAPTHLVADLAGWFPDGSPYVGRNPVRLLDTRDCIVGEGGPTSPTGATACAPVRHAFPVAPGVPASYGRSHAGYPGTDVFAACGAPAVVPADGVVLQVRRTDAYVRSQDNPALRGGRSVAILGNDGVRYYGAHFDTIDPAIVVGARVVAGQAMATVGRSGDTSVCHIHVGISIPCTGSEWSVRRGLVWPWPYLDAWRAGQERSPVGELAALARARPLLCAEAMALPTAADAA